jgi:hypothetical protein
VPRAGTLIFAVLDDRMKDDEANPDAGATWDVVRERLRDNLRRR